MDFKTVRKLSLIFRSSSLITVYKYKFILNYNVLFSLHNEILKFFVNIFFMFLQVFVYKKAEN